MDRALTRCGCVGAVGHGMGRLAALTAGLLLLATLPPPGAWGADTAVPVSDVRLEIIVSTADDPRVAPVRVSWRTAERDTGHAVELRAEAGPWQALGSAEAGRHWLDVEVPIGRVVELRVASLGEGSGQAWAISEPVTVSPTDRGLVATSPPHSVVLIAGDIAGCDWTADSATASLVARAEGLVMTAGDHAYQSGGDAEFRACYDPTWGRVRKRTRPVPGNHDYARASAAAYFRYFGERAGPRGRGYYAFDLGTWRIYALDSNCEVTGQCHKGSAQYRWLVGDLAAHPRRCVMAVLHHPHFSSGRHGNSRKTMPLITLLYRAGAEIVVNGHDHVYERFAPARPWGTLDREHGIRQFIVGTGGAPLYAWKPQGRPAHSQRRENRTYGVLELELGWERYRWQFLRAAGRQFSDAGSGTCHDASDPAAAR